MLEEVRSDQEVFDPEQEKIMLRFPKNFNVKLDDMLVSMQQDYAGVLEQQKKYTVDKLNKISLNVEKITQDLNNLKCKNSDIVAKLSSGMMTAYVMNADDLTELLLEDMLDELVWASLTQVEYLNAMESIKTSNSDLIEANLKKNRLKTRMAASQALGVWQLVEKLEEYKDDSLLCED